jgi:molybdopterin synthase sulfur carrier subunit
MARVLLFGAFGDLAGWSERDIDATSLGDLKARIGALEPRLAERLSLRSTLTIINDVMEPHSLRDDTRPLAPTDEVAFGPPVSGG